MKNLKSQFIELKVLTLFPYCSLLLFSELETGFLQILDKQEKLWQKPGFLNLL